MGRKFYFHPAAYLDGKWICPYCGKELPVDEKGFPVTFNTQRDRAHKFSRQIFLLILSICLIASGFTDLDWQLVSYRYSEWHRQVDYWEYCPFFRVNWWLAYLFNVLRFAIGCFLLGMLCKRALPVDERGLPITQTDWPCVTSPPVPFDSEVEVSVWNCQATVLLNKEPLDFDKLPKKQANKLERLAIESVERAGGAINWSGIYPPTEKLCQYINWLRKRGYI